MKKNHIIAAALAILLAGCSAENTASTSENVSSASSEAVVTSVSSETDAADEKAPDSKADGDLVRVTSYDGKTLTGTKLDMPKMGGNKPEGQGTPPDMNSGDMPENPDNSDGNPPQGKAPEGNTPPEMSGETVTYTVSASADISIEISEGDMVRIVTDENGEITGIEKEEFGGMPMGQMGHNGFGANGTDNGTAANSVSDNAVLSDTSFTSDGDDENALRADNVTATLEKVTITKTGSSSNTENGDFYGMNAAFLAQNGADITITGGDVTTDAVNGNGIFSYGSGTVVNVSGTKIRTSQRNSGGIQTTGGGVMNAENLDIETSGNSSAAIRSDRGGGTVTVNGGTYVTNGTGSPAVYSTADITV